MAQVPMSRCQRLSGYLHVKPTGPFRRLKGSQRLWHALDESTLVLNAFRTEEEAGTPNKEPLKSIMLAQASFSVDPNEMNQFVITVDGKDYVLQAETEEAMFLWLTTLQACRNEALNNGLFAWTQDENTGTVDRKKPQKLQLGKITTPILRTTNAPSFDVNDVFSSSPVPTRKDWRPGMGTPLPVPQVNSPLQRRITVTSSTTSGTSPELSRFLPGLISSGKLRPRSHASERDFETAARDSNPLFYGDDTEDDLESASLNRETSFVQPAPLLVSTTTPIADKLKYFSLSTKNVGSTKITRKFGLIRQMSTTSSNGVSTGELMSVSLTGPDTSELVAIDDAFSCPPLDGVSETVSQADEDADTINKGNEKLFSSSQQSESAALSGRRRTSTVSTNRLSHESDQNSTPLLSGTDEILPYYQHEPYLNKLREAQAQIAAYQERESHLRELLQQRESTIAELDQRIGQMEENEEKPVELNIPVGASCAQLREMLKQWEIKRRHMANRVQFLVSEVRDLSTLRQMLTDHGSKQVRYTKKLTSEVTRWKQHFVTLLETYIGALHAEPTHDLLFCDYGKQKYKAKICELVDEARRRDPSLPSLTKPKNADYHVDSFGFKHSYSDETVVLHFVCRQLRDFYARQLAFEDEATNQWAEILRQPNRELSRSELKILCRAGVPPALRGGIWRMLVHGEMKQIMTSKGPHYYNRLISEISESKIATRYRKQISLDLLRTMPTNVLFDSIEAPGIQKLQEILQAYSIHNPDIGYCQGMNFLVAVALIFLNKEDAFWCLTAILEKYLPEKYFNCGLINAQVDQLVLKDLLSSKLPKLAEHVRKMEIDISAITLNWFLAVFYDSVPFETLIRIWDIFLLEGSKCLFRFALALLKRNEDMLLLQTDTISFWKCLKTASRMTYDAESLIQTAYEELHPFASRSTISALQLHHYEILNKEMSEKQKLWQNVVKEVNEEASDDSRVVLRRKKSDMERSCIQAAMAFDDESIWICHGERLCTHLAAVEVQDCRMKHMMFDLDGRVSCLKKLTDDIILFGMMSSKICAYSAETKQLLWELPVHDSVTDLAVVHWEHESTNKVFAGLSNGELVIIENAGDKEPQDSVYMFTIGFLRVSSILLVENQLWCACGNGVYIFNTATLDYQGHFFISNNALDLILTLKLGKHGVWLAVRGSSLIELWEPSTLNRLLLFNTFSEMYVNRREDEEGMFNANRVTALLPYEDTIWVGTGSGLILVFEIREGSEAVTGHSESTSPKETEASTVFLPPKTLELCEGMSSMPRMGRRRSSFDSVLSASATHSLRQLAETGAQSSFDRGDRIMDEPLTAVTEELSVDDLTEESPNGVTPNLEIRHVNRRKQREVSEVKCQSDKDVQPQNAQQQTDKSLTGNQTSCPNGSDGPITNSPENEKKLNQTACTLGDSGLSSPRMESDEKQVRKSVTLEDNIVLHNGWNHEPSSSVILENDQTDLPTDQKKSMLHSSKPPRLTIDDPASLSKRNNNGQLESVASSPSTGIHDMQSTTSEDSSPVFPNAVPMFNPLRSDVRVIEQSSDASLRFQLHLIARSKVSETAIRVFLSHRRENDERCIISCATFFNDDDAVLRWQKWTTEPLIWTNQPIFLYDPTSQTVQLPSYMMNTMKMRKEARRRITVAM